MGLEGPSEEARLEPREYVLLQDRINFSFLCGSTRCVISRHCQLHLLSWPRMLPARPVLPGQLVFHRPKQTDDDVIGVDTAAGDTPWDCHICQHWGG